MKDVLGAKTWRRSCSMGFTLIELMIVVAIIAILSALAYPSYITYITKSRRVSAEGCLSQYANYMERYYTTNLGYVKDTNSVANVLPTLDCGTPQQTGTYYRYDWPIAPTPATFTVEAVPLVAQATRDKTCGTLTLDQAGARTANGAPVVSGSGCW